MYETLKKWKQSNKIKKNEKTSIARESDWRCTARFKLALKTYTLKFVKKKDFRMQRKFLVASTIVAAEWAPRYSQWSMKARLKLQNGAWKICKDEQKHTRTISCRKKEKSLRMSHSRIILTMLLALHTLRKRKRAFSFNR